MNYYYLINIATIIVLIAICVLFNNWITKYLKWKSEEIKEGFFYDKNVEIGIVSMMKNPKNIDTWLNTHRTLGIKHFYIRLEDSPKVESFLNEQTDVTLQIGKSTGINEYDEIQTRQNTWVNEAFKIALTDKNQIGWLIHIDSDELLEGSIHTLNALPENVRTFWIQNHEAKFEGVPSKTNNCFSAAEFIDCAKEPGKCVSYGNGKSGGRVAKDVSANGPHRMKSSHPNAVDQKIDDIIVQHFESCDFDIYKQKFEQLAKQNKGQKAIPFKYYNESIHAANENDDTKLRQIYSKYRVVGDISPTTPFSGSGL